eukprot:2584253-Rhodomonas_salina.1
MCDRCRGGADVHEWVCSCDGAGVHGGQAMKTASVDNFEDLAGERVRARPRVCCDERRVCCDERHACAAMSGSRVHEERQTCARLEMVIEKERRQELREGRNREGGRVREGKGRKGEREGMLQ